MNELAAQVLASEEAADYDDEIVAACWNEAYPLEAFEREAYPSLHVLYRELRRVTPRPKRKETSP